MKEFLERECQGHFSPSTGRGERVLDFQPLFVMRARCVWVFCPLVLPQVLRGSISAASLLSSDDADRFAETGKPWRLPGWQHIDLSEARGLVLFRVVREGIGITRRLSASGHLHAYRPLGILTLEPERLKNRSTTTRERIAGDGKRLSPETLKRLAISVSRRRSFLPSSTASA